MTKLEKLKQNFLFDDERNPLLRSYGTYRLGLTEKEIANYLYVRDKGKSSVKKLQKKFYETAGVNTCSLLQIKCPTCSKINNISLMYRHDVKRFADVLFNNSLTYFD